MIGSRIAAGDGTDRSTLAHVVPDRLRFPAKNPVSSIMCSERWSQVNNGSTTILARDDVRSDAVRETRPASWSARVLSKMLDIPFGFRPKIALAGIRTRTPANPTGETPSIYFSFLQCFCSSPASTHAEISFTGSLNSFRLAHSHISTNGSRSMIEASSFSSDGASLSAAYSA